MSMASILMWDSWLSSSSRSGRSGTALGMKTSSSQREKMWRSTYPKNIYIYIYFTGNKSLQVTLDHDIDPLVGVHYADLKPLVNSYIQHLVQIKWDVAVHGSDIYFEKPTLGPLNKFQHLTRTEEVVITRLQIGHTKATKSHILSRGPPTACHHCGQTLTFDHILLECAVLQECRDEYYTADSLNTLFETIPETCIVEFLREVGFFYLIWHN